MNIMTSVGVMVSDYLLRLCAVCGREIGVTIFKSNRHIISGGFYFGTHYLSGRDIEYWECHQCFNRVDNPAAYHGFKRQETYIQSRKSR